MDFFFLPALIVKMTSYYLNLNLLLHSCAAVVLQSMIILVANSLYIKILLGGFFGSCANSHLYFP